MKDAMRLFPLRSFSAGGWLKDQIEKDLVGGFVGDLDRLAPDLILEDDIYGRNRLSREVKSKDVGAIAQDGEWQIQYLWWNSETQSNWRDGFVRSAFLTGHAESIERCIEYVEHILETQDEDGYLGIYAPDLRYSFDGENGELWAQSSLFRVLLGYYEFTGEERILQAVERAMAVTMKAYPPEKSDPFGVASDYAGHTHGLTITDSLEWLYRLTGKQEYLDYAIWLYDNYCSHELSEPDIRLENLLNDEYRFTGHGPHTYEHLRTLAIAARHGDESRYQLGLAGYLNKLHYHLTPSGGPVGDEWVTGRTADAGETGYEYCSLQELLHSYGMLLRQTGDVKWADRMEWLMYNAAMGARHPEHSGISYCKTDNSFSMVGGRHEGFKLHGSPDYRYKYSPTHQDCAVCCSPNAGRIFPYFIGSMYHLGEEGISVDLYGPSALETELVGASLRIVQISEYPRELESHFVVTCDQPRRFALRLRIPAWASGYELDAPFAEKNSIRREGNALYLSHNWNRTLEFTIRFDAEIQSHSDLKGDIFISRGPLVYALPISSSEEAVRDFGFGGYKDYYCRAAGDTGSSLRFDGAAFKNPGAIVLPHELDGAGWTVLRIPLYDEMKEEIIRTELVPMAHTILRRVTFPERN